MENKWTSRPNRGPWLGVLVTAGLLAMVFPPLGFWPFAYIALVPGAMALVRAKKLFGFVGMSWLVGCLWWGVMGSWMVPVTVGGHIGASILMGTQLAVVVWGMGLLNRKFKWPMVAVLPLGWMLLEVIRATVPWGGMNWFTLAQSQAAKAPGQSVLVVQIADVFGWPVVSFFVALVNGVVVDSLTLPLMHAYVPPKQRRAMGETLPEGQTLAMAWKVRRRMTGLARWSWGGLTMLVVVVLGYGQSRLAESHRHAWEGPRVGLVQTDILQDNKNARTLAVDEGMWAQLEQGTLDLVAAQKDGPALDWIVWPETAVPGPLSDDGAMFWMQKAAIWSRTTPDQLEPGPLAEAAASYGVAPENVPAYLMNWYAFRGGCLQAVENLAAESKATLIAGVPAQLGVPDGADVNRVVVVDPETGVGTEAYDKIHRVPFGEYLPVVESFPALKTWFIQTFTPYDHDYGLAQGTNTTPFVLTYQATDKGKPITKTARVATPVCFEDTVARLCRRLVLDEAGNKRADVLVNLTNDGWFAGSSQNIQQLQLASLRCIENRVPMVRSVNTGVSASINSTGQIEASLLPSAELHANQQGKPTTLSVKVTLDDRRPLFLVWGMWPVWGVCIGTGLAMLAAFFASFVAWRGERGERRARKRDGVADGAGADVQVDTAASTPSAAG